MHDNKEQIDMDDLIRACVRIIYDAPENSLDDGDNIEIIAYHEAGHALVAELFEPGTVSLVSVKKNHGDIGGFAATSLPKGYWYSKKRMEERAISILAGKAATELILGIVDPGSENDITRAFRIVQRFVDDFCANGFDRSLQYENASEDLLCRRETVISAEVERLYNQAKSMLREHKQCLCDVATALIINKVITKNQLRSIIDENLKEAS